MARSTYFFGVYLSGNYIIKTQEGNLKGNLL